MNDERSLVLELKQAKEAKIKVKETLDVLEKHIAKVETDLFDLLEAKQAKSTSKYEGIGYAQIQKPRLYASCNEENMPKLIEYLISIDRGDMIKTIVKPQTLSAFVAEQLQNGTEINASVSYYLKPTIKLYE